MTEARSSASSARMLDNVSVVETWPYWCLACRIALHLLRSVRAGMCCCCRTDHAPDVRIDVTLPTAADVTLAVVA